MPSQKPQVSTEHESNSVGWVTVVQGLTASAVVRAWEAGHSRHPVDRGLLLLALGCPGLSWDHLASLTIGQRNDRLLALREATLGPMLSAHARCRHCGETLEFQFAAASIRQPEPDTTVFSLEVDGYSLRCRLPTSLDLAAVPVLSDVIGARRLLFERCVLEARHADAVVAADGLPDSLLPDLAEAMGDRDPGAETRFLLSCFNCGQDTSVFFDIVSYFWTEIDAYAKRLIAEVDTLARTYAWREADILAMSSDRRKLYLDLIGR